MTAARLFKLRDQDRRTDIRIAGQFQGGWIGLVVGIGCLEDLVRIVPLNHRRQYGHEDEYNHKNQAGSPQRLGPQESTE
ncbi:MAG: hypothetical protein F4X58_07100 [Chloroflexi bacterium]|nr:hypothetical protein [Chloroflexota bacterium]